MVNILHLYNDLMNLYGEVGNILAIEYYLKENKIKYTLDNKSIKDKINFDKYDIVYIGCGTESNQKIALKHLSEYTNDLKKYINDKKILIATGNSYEMFGRYIENINGKRFQGLSIFNYYSKEKEDRTVIQVNNDQIKGFINIGSVVSGNNKPLFTIEENKEGHKYKNFYGTHIIGPILVLNDDLLDNIIENIK